MAAPSDQFFEQDDEETLELLLSPAAVSCDDMKTRLAGLLDRFSNDSTGSSDESFWASICNSAEELGFRVSGVSAALETDGESSSSPPSFPAAFETDSGKKHIEATSSMLRISKERAVQLTLSALRSLNGGKDAGETHVQSLLGTRALLKTVRNYHYQQRTSRLLVITECLRIEQDEDSPNNEAATQMLNDFDKTFVLDGRKRGLFHRLLCTACAPYSPPTRQELLSTLDLRSETPDTLVTAQLESSADDTFTTEWFQASRVQTLTERVQAMEALLVLLYHFIQDGIHRIDYVLILLAFESYGEFFTTEKSKRLSYLASLITAECMNLCMTSAQETDPAGMPLWVLRHPILLGVVQGDSRAVNELQAIVMLLVKYANQVPNRKLAAMVIRRNSDTSSTVDAPEAIALYSFALLLLLVQQHLPQDGEAVVNGNRFDFGKDGMECVELASEECGVFDYLHATMEALVTTPIRDSFSSERDIPYDWQFSGDSTPLVLEGPSEQEELNSANVAYASIGMEILSSTIVALKGTIRSGNSISLENVTMLCSLAATIYGNHPLLCKAFWRNLEEYSSEGTRRSDLLTSRQALCYLVDAAHACATSALNAVALAEVGDNPGLEENLLPSLVPLLQLMSSLCSSSEMVESVLKLLPKNIIRNSLLCCAPTRTVTDTTAFTKNALQVVQAVQSLARVGRSSHCRALLRSSLEEQDGDTLDGPRVMYHIISWQPNTNIVSSTLRIMGYFVEIPGRGHELWIAKASKYFGPSGLGDNGLPALLTGQSRSVALSGLHVLSGLVENIATIAFSPTCEETDTLDVLAVALKGVAASCMLLTTLLSSNSAQSPEAGGSSFLVAHGVLRCCAMFLRELRPIINMHASLRVKAAAQEARSILLQGLSTSTPVGQAIAYFASAPVSLSLAAVLEEMLLNANVMQIASDEYVRESDPLDFGAWRSVADASREMKPAVEVGKVRSDAQDILANIHELDVDVQGFQAKGWTEEPTAMEPLLAASVALDLLRLWALSANDTVVERHGLRTGSDTPLSPDAVSELEALSPCRLIFSQIVRPPVVERSSSLRQVWPTDTLSLCHVLIRYLAGENEGGQHLPSLTASDVFSLALVDAKHFSQPLHFAVVDAIVLFSPEISLVLKRVVSKAVSATSGSAEGGEMSFEDDVHIRKGLASLRVLSVCLELDAQVVAAICTAESSPLDVIIDILSSLATMIRNGTSLSRVSSDSFDVCQLRLASAAIHVLQALSKSCGAKNAGQTISEAVAVFKSNIVTDLVVIVKFAARELSRDFPGEPKILHLVSVLAAAASDALGVLTKNTSEDLGDSLNTDTSARAAVNDMVTGSFSSLSRSFSTIGASVTTAKSWSRLESTIQSSRNVSVNDPRSILSSFPAAYRSQMESHASQENICDIVQASSWAKTGISAELKKCNASVVFLSKQLALVASWGRFAQLFSLTEKNEVPANVSLSMTRAVLVDLGRISTEIEEAQMLVSVNYLPVDVAIASNVLAGLLVEVMSGYVRENKTSAAAESLIEMLTGFHNTMGKLLASTSVNRPDHHVVSLVFPSYLVRETAQIREETYFMCCALQKRLLVTASLFLSELDQTTHSREVETKIAKVALQFVEEACKSLERIYGPRRDGSSDSRARLSDELLDARVSLLNVLLSRDRGTKYSLTGNSQFYSGASALMKRSNVMESLVSNVETASRLAVATASSVGGAQANPEFVADENQVEIVQSILGFVRTIAVIGEKSEDMLSLLSPSGVLRMILDNPLFNAANHQWVANRLSGHTSDHLSELRGYVPLNGKVPVEMSEGDSRTVVTGTFLSGRDDPVHLAWRTSLQILQALVSAYSNPRYAADVTSRHFADCAFAFLKKYFISFIACLKQCSSLSSDSRQGPFAGTVMAAQVSHTVLTFNALGETGDILALVSSICSNGTYLQTFENAYGDVYHGLAAACHAVIDGLSEFLAAAGTSKEIFEAMKDYESQFQESANREGFGLNDPQFEVNPLLSNGIPHAKHEAIKHAHYASRCCALVTSEDYKGLPSGSSGSAQISTSTLEKNSQASMSSPFISRMEHAAAECVYYALSVVSDTHPASSCFVVFSPEEVRRRDMLSLLTEDMVISARSEQGSSDASLFYRVVHVDTVRRQCHVRSLGDQGEQAQSVLSVDRVDGIEDMSKRHPVLIFSAAPTSFEELERATISADGTASVGDLISVLRWCYQYVGSGVEDEKRKVLRKAVAESASVLLSTELSLHQEIGTFSMTNRDDLSKCVMAQLLQLFDDSNKAPRWSGKLKQIIEPSIWSAVLQQLEEELRVARNDRREKSLQSLKRAAAVAGASVWGDTSSDGCSAFQS